jgi:hypothetical protein
MKKPTLDVSHPNLCKQWHPTLNGDNRPNQYTYGMIDKIWWLCPVKYDCQCPHEWDAFIYSRTRGSDLD